jgi:diguanylate cyclase (GGDEF)-like protein
MPNMSGLEMAKEIKSINSNMPIIVATAFSNSEYLLEAIDLGVDKYLLKPVNIKKLLDTMAKSLLYHELRDLYLDQLTKLPNRNALIKDINTQDISTIALIDIDKFSLLNDLYGEENGDKILEKFANKINSFFPKESYKTYRVGSDKFVVLLKLADEEIKACEDNCVGKLREFAEDFTTAIEQNGIELDDDLVDLNITIGIASVGDKHAFEYAQRALQKARSKYVQIMTYEESDLSQKEDYKENIKWIKKLKNGISDGCFQPFFQPIVDAETKTPYKYEALIRYIDNDGNEIPPYKFLPIAKKAKLYPVIIKVMLTGVIKTITEKKVKVAVNISFEDISNKDTYDFIILTLMSNPEEAKYLDFEVLESEEIEDFEIVKKFISEVKSYGCGVGVDDFGAGYSNFNMLEALDIDFVKIDGSLIKDINNLPKQALIVETIAGFCKKLNIKTVAEFVSSDEIYEVVKGFNVNYMQGYNFGKPVSKSEL